jgi:hypothetical protein
LSKATNNSNPMSLHAHQSQPATVSFGCLPTVLAGPSCGLQVLCETDMMWSGHAVEGSCFGRIGRKSAAAAEFGLRFMMAEAMTCRAFSVRSLSKRESLRATQVWARIHGWPGGLIASGRGGGLLGSLQELPASRRIRPHRLASARNREGRRAIAASTEKISRLALLCTNRHQSASARATGLEPATTGSTERPTVF